MNLEKYYELHYLQELTEIDTGQPPPADKTREFRDAREVCGFFLQKKSGEASVADANPIRTQGRFATHPSTELSQGSVLRRARDGAYIRIASDPQIAPEFAKTQVKAYEAYVTNREEVRGGG